MIQRAWRCYLARKKLKELKRKRDIKVRNAAALLIQRVYRGHIGRERFKRIKAEWLAERQHWAAIKIQV